MLDTQYFHLGSNILSVLKASNEMDSTLLITGSTGTGKSHMAHAVHKASKRGGGTRWFKVNLATLSENLIESELFGHERGAFTGADARRVGRLEMCNGGTVFLDEIGELPLRLQAKLLDFIQYKKISPVGSNREISLDVRIIAATNRNLATAVKAGEFRADLYHRLNVFHVELPDLMVNHRAVVEFSNEIINSKAKLVDKKIDGLAREVEEVFRTYTWPGNIRELENTLEYAIAMEGGEQVSLSSLPSYLQGLSTTKVATRVTEKPVTSLSAGTLELPVSMDFHESKDCFEKMYLEHALRVCAGQINLTSRRIGLNKVSLADKIKKHGIDWRQIRYDSLGPGIRVAT